MHDLTPSLFLAALPESVSAPLLWRMSPLHTAVVYERPEVLDAMLAAGARVEDAVRAAAAASCRGTVETLLRRERKVRVGEASWAEMRSAAAGILDKWGADRATQDGNELAAALQLNDQARAADGTRAVAGCHPATPPTSAPSLRRMSSSSVSPPCPWRPADETTWTTWSSGHSAARTSSQRPSNGARGVVAVGGDGPPAQRAPVEVVGASLAAGTCPSRHSQPCGSRTRLRTPCLQPRSTAW